MVAAAKLRRSQEKVMASRPFTRKISEVLGRLATASGEASHPLLDVREPEKVGYVVVTADRGLCGGLNANVIRRAVQEIREYANVSLITVGRKGRDYFKRRGQEIEAEFVGLGDSIGFIEAKEIAQTIIEKYTSGSFDVVYLIYTEFINAINQRPLTIKLLPVDPPAAEEKVQTEYIFEPSAGAVLADLLPKYVETQVYRALLESKASEMGAKMTAMGAATDNATEMINKLTLSLNRARQAAITKEISEIVGGAAALE